MLAVFCVRLEKRLSLPGAKVLVLGAGGAARAAVFGLVQQGSRGSDPETALRRQGRSWRAEAKAKNHSPRAGRKSGVTLAWWTK